VVGRKRGENKDLKEKTEQGEKGAQKPGSFMKGETANEESGGVQMGQTRKAELTMQVDARGRA